MPYPSNIEQKLEFDQIRELVRKKCISGGGVRYLERVRFIQRADIVHVLLEQVKEFMDIVRFEPTFPTEHYYDLQEALQRVRPEGSWLMEDELHRISGMFQTFRSIQRFFNERSGRFSHLEKVLQGSFNPEETIRTIARIIDKEGLLKPNASPELLHISQAISEKEREIRRVVQRVFEKAQQHNWLADTGITIRDERLVIPVMAEHKRHIHGFIHDESSTGQTIFIEPAESFEANNKIRELKIAYKRERERILIEITSQLRPYFPDMEKSFSRMYLLDFIRAKALFSIDIEAEIPILQKHPVIRLFSAIHPILKMHLQRMQSKAVPLDVHLENDKRILVISGPNAGGKSVCMKTIGLLQYMLQCGFPVPCLPHSEMFVFQDVLVDLGDEQSIENDISTYSSHLRNMHHFIRNANKKTLFLIDEFGTGTDPQFGGPLAEAVLYELNMKQSFGVVTTHYSNLKNFASTTSGLENARMLFDSEHMQPLFILEQGKPGSSYAFELAQKSGLSTAVIQYARQRAGYKQKKVDDILVELEKEQKHALEIRARYTEREKKSMELQQKYEALLLKLEQDKKALVLKSKQEALAIVSEATGKVEKMIRDIREKQADSDIQKEVRKEIQSDKEQLKQTIHQIQQEIKPTKEITIDGEIEEGSYVKMEGQVLTGIVEKIEKKKAIVLFGEIKTTVPLNKLLLSSKKEQKKELKSYAQTSVDMNEKMQHFQNELNIIGVRGEDAIRQVQQFVDEAYLLGFKQVRIVHGKGYGILRKLVRNFLMGTHFIDSLENEHIDFGGDGVTIVHFK